MVEFAHQLEFISTLGSNPVVIFSLISIVAYFLVKKRHFYTSLIMVLTSASLFYSTFLKSLFQQQRPLLAPTEHYWNFDIYGFPSTHVLFYTSFWGFIFYLSYKYVEESKLSWHVARWISAYMIMTVGASRVYLGVHYIKDVIAGYIFGLLFLLLLVWIDGFLEKSVIKDQ